MNSSHVHTNLASTPLGAFLLLKMCTLPYIICYSSMILTWVTLHCGVLNPCASLPDTKGQCVNLDSTQKGHYKMLISDDVSVEMCCRVQFEPIVYSMQHHSDNWPS